MPASITGIVFDDLNGNGIYDGGEPGIPNAYVVLEDPNGVCTNVQTNGAGNYSFVNLTVEGDYTIYETVANPFITCPPTNFTQPAGYNMSTTPRSLALTITAADIANNVVFADQNFGHQNITTWECSPNGLQIAGDPANAFNINLVTGASMFLGSLTPPGLYNGIGFNELDNTIWGSDHNIAGNVFRLNPDLTVSSFNIPNLPGTIFNTGDIDLNGHLYLYSTVDPLIFYVVDVNPDSPTFLQLVDPTNGFVLDTAPFGTAIVSLNAYDWAFNPIDSQLYAATNGGGVVRIDPLTGGVTSLVTAGLPGGFYGAQFFDSSGALYALNNGNGDIYRITFSGANANAVLFSSSVVTSLNDGARCTSALLSLVEVTKSVDPMSTCPSGILTFTSVVENVGALLDAINVIFTDDIPAGTTFVNSSVFVDGVSMPAADPTVGIALGDIGPMDSVTITFQVTVDTFPAPTFPIINTSRASGDNAEEVFSNEVSVSQASTDLSVDKTATPSLVEIGDVIIYTVTVTNNGPDDIQNITLIDVEPTGTNFIPNSVTVDGVLRPGEDPNAGIVLQDLAVGESTTVRFRVMTVSGDRFIPNTAEVRYCLGQVIESNQVITLICGNTTIC